MHVSILASTLSCFFAAALGSAAALSAQVDFVSTDSVSQDGAARMPTIARVVDGHGTPIEAATVVFWRRPEVGLAPIVPGDEIVRTSNANGRVTAKLAMGLAYCVQATWIDGEGRMQASHILSCMADQVVDLTPAPGAYSYRLRVEGSGLALGRRGALRVRVREHAMFARTLFERRIDGFEGKTDIDCGFLPVDKFAGLHVEVFDDVGCLVVARPVRHGFREGPRPGPADVDAATIVVPVSLEEEERFALTVLDARGKAAVGARVFVDVGADKVSPLALRPVGVTGASGKIVVSYARGRSCVLRVRMPGHAEGFIEIDRRHLRVQGEVATTRQPGEAISLRLEAATPYTLELVCGSETTATKVPLANVLVEVRRRAWIATPGEGRRSYALCSEVFATDSEGKLVLAYLPANVNDLELLVWPSPDDTYLQGAATTASRMDVMQRGTLRLRGARHRRGDPADVVSLTTTLPNVEFVVMANNGEAVRGSRLCYAISVQGQWKCVEVQATSDRRGQLRCTLPETVKQVLLWAKDHGFVYDSLESGQCH